MAKKASKKTGRSGATRSATATRGRGAGSANPAAAGTAGGAAGRAGGRGPTRARQSYTAGDAVGKHLVIVESPSKAKTINKYLGKDYVVLASIGHVRDLPSKAPKGDKSPVPGVDLERGFAPTYEVLEGKESVVRDLKRAAKDALGSGGEVWFATDLDREGEAIAWHLAQELGISSARAKRVIFAAITQAEIDRAFHNPHPIDEDRVNAQQARRILDRIVGYQVSPLLWKKVTRGLSAGRVQSVAVRLVVEREREIRVFVPDEYWSIEGLFALSEAEARALGPAWTGLLGQRDERGNGPTVKAQNGWLAEHRAIRAELVEVGGEKFDVRAAGDQPADLAPRVLAVAEAIGLRDVRVETSEDAEGRGPARARRLVTGIAEPTTPYRVRSIETKRTTTRPAPPFITSTLQQAASTRLGFGAQRTMRAAQALYEGVDIPGEGPVGLITYMRTDSTHLAPEALAMARDYIGRTFGKSYLPDAPNTYRSSNKDAQEAHEAIRPTDAARTPDALRRALKPDEHRLYELIWERFLACQMTPAQWDSTTVLIERPGRGGGSAGAVFRASGRVLVFDGFTRVAGAPPSSDEATLPRLEARQELRPFAFDVEQKFTSPPPRYTEASLIKVLESEGIGRPSTYAAIIQTIQDRNYVELMDRRMYATDLGEVVTDKLIEAFPRIMDVGYTREMEAELDKVEEEHLDWIDMLRRFYGPFKQSLERAHDELQHAKAETQPAPDEYRCDECGSSMVYRFGRNGRFLSCARYPDCKYACPVDRQGRPRRAEFVNVRCPRTGRPMIKRTGRFGPFIATQLLEGEDQSVGVILNLDKKGKVTAPSPPPLITELPCPTCESPLNLRPGVRGPWLGCSRFPKCRGRGKWAELGEAARGELEGALERHAQAHPIPIITTLDGRALTDKQGKPLPEAPSIDELGLDEDKLAALTGSARSVA